MLALALIAALGAAPLPVTHIDGAVWARGL